MYVNTVCKTDEKPCLGAQHQVTILRLELTNYGLLALHL